MFLFRKRNTKIRSDMSSSSTSSNVSNLQNASSAGFFDASTTDIQGSRMYSRFEENITKLKLFGIFLEVILLGLAFATAQAWATFITVSAESFAASTSDVIQKLIAATIITAVAILLSILSVIYLYTRPRRISLHSATSVPDEENDKTNASNASKGRTNHLNLAIPASRAR